MKIPSEMASRRPVVALARAGCCLLAGALGACSSQVGPGYLGESLTEVRGIIVDSPIPGDNDYGLTARQSAKDTRCGFRGSRLG